MTAFNYIDPLSFISTNKGLIRSEKINPGLLLKTTNNSVQLVEDVSREEVVVKEIIFENGTKMFLWNKSSCELIDGIEPVSKIISGSLVQHSFYNYFGVQKAKNIAWDNINKGKSLNIKVPSEMTDEFALWLGCITVQSKISGKSGSIELEVTKLSNSFITMFSDLTKKIFDITPKMIVTKDKRKFIQIMSKNLVRFVHIAIGKVGFVKKIPSIIQESSLKHQLKYFEGLSLKSYYDKKRLVFYSGLSKTLAEYIGTFLINIGYHVSIKKTLSGNKKNIFYVYVNNKHKDAIQIQMILLGSVSVKSKYTVKVPEIATDISKYFGNSSYRTLKIIQKKGLKTCSNQVLDNLKLDYNSNNYFIKVKSVKILKKEMIKVSLANNSTIILNGLVYSA